MREYGRTEVIREWCHFCGCGNKLVTYLKDRENGQEVAMHVRCCACGHVENHIDPARFDLIAKSVYGKLSVSRSKCIQNEECPHKQCPLYGTCRPRKEPPKNGNTQNVIINDRSNRLLDRNKPFVKDYERPRIEHRRFNDGDK